MFFRSSFRVLLSVTLVGSACCILPGEVQAEGDEFFEKDFAVSPLEKENKRKRASPEEYSKSRARKNRTNQAGGVESVPSSNGFSEMAEPEPEPETVVANEEYDPNDKSLVPIVAVDAVINFVDVPHGIHAMNVLFEAIQDHELPIGDVFALGRSGPVLADWSYSKRIQFFGLGAKVKGTRFPPEDLPVKSSPSWIFYTEKGRYIAEGIDAIKRLTTPSGKLKISQFPVIAVAVTPKPTVPARPTR